ncbi:MAG: carbamoyltransferase HypF, partial [Verrucomicrobia bacterium]|nr:carbamoyltransferase HypF [Verrucomicrobiota bacterium]
MAAPAATDRARVKACVRGAVQGVGFRPFVYRLATELALTGWVNNSSQGVFLQVEGPRLKLEKFLLRLEAEKPPRSFIQSLEATWLDALGYAGFEIRASDRGGEKTALVLPDIATCPDCLREIFDPANRRYRYPFTNCTNCGPRFSLIEALPYDRAHTSMKAFMMCPLCQAEYDDPCDRRFHAQPNACPVCGPHLELWQADDGGRGRERATDLAAEAMQPRSHERSHEAVVAAAAAIRAGQIVAVKGLGGFHLMVAAHDEQAVRRLRERKHREEKPFALMFPSLESVKAVCEVSPLEERLLRSPEAPIVLLRRLAKSQISNSRFQIAAIVAPNNPCLGVMLPYTPLHHLLMAELGFPVVATSGNLSEEPICTDEHEALARLGGIADAFLVLNRPIVRQVDDSIVRVMMGRELVLRRARGYAPLPIGLKSQISILKSQIKSRAGPPHLGCSNESVLAVGAHLKNTVALALGPQVFVSQHIGDLETEQSFAAFRRVIADFEKLYEAQPALILDNSRDSYKWPALRSVHSPEVQVWLQEIRRRQLLPDSTVESVGNWASLEREEMGTLGSIIDEPQPTTLFHGTNTYRWDLAERAQALHTLPSAERVWRDKVPAAQRDFLFFTTSRERAAYYANKAVDVDRRRGRKGTRPVVLSFKVTPDDLPRLRADNDYLEREDIHGGKTDPIANAWDSLALFGQVAIDGRI